MNPSNPKRYCILCESELEIFELANSKYPSWVCKIHGNQDKSFSVAGRDGAGKLVVEIPK